MRWARITLGVVAVAAALIGPASASAAVGDLTYKGCISGNTALGPDHCELTAGAASNGTLSGLNSVESVTVSPDGRRVYAAGRDDDSIALFKRDPQRGALTFAGCYTGDSLSGACDQIPTDTSGGHGSGLDDVRAVAIAPGGKQAYTVSAQDDAVARFKRHVNGRLEFLDCVTGDTDSGPGGTGACTQLPSAAAGGANSGLDHPKSLVVSPDGKSLYVASTEDTAIVRFKRDTASGELTFKDCVTGETESGSAGSGACTEIDADGGNGDNSGLDDPRGLAVTKDGKTLLGVSSDDDALFVFDRAGNGALTFDSCFTGESETAAANPDCDTLIATSNGTDSGFDDSRSIAVSRDASSIYLVSRFDAAIVHFQLSGPQGVECYSADTGAAGDDPCISILTPTAGGNNSGFGSPESAVLSHDGRTLYVSSANDAGVAAFKRNLDTGALSFKGCITGEIGVDPPCEGIPEMTANGLNSGLDFPQFIGLSPDDKSLYVAAAGDDAVATFKRKR